MNEVSTCRSCGAPVIWVLTSVGKRMPLDAEPVLRFVRSGRAGESAQLVKTYGSHFVTCPHADKWRKGE